MIELKVKIQNSFNKASKSYDQVASVQRKAAKFLIERLLECHTETPQTILDLGTGTGCIPELLLKFYPDSFYTLNDIADQMLEFCKYKFVHHKNFVFSNDDMSALSMSHYDLIISNFALQWVDE